MLLQVCTLILLELLMNSLSDPFQLPPLSKLLILFFEVLSLLESQVGRCFVKAVSVLKPLDVESDVFSDAIRFVAWLLHFQSDVFEHLLLLLTSL